MNWLSDIRANSDEDDANGHLIVAAPALLAACYAALLCCQDDPLKRQIETAIAQAEGKGTT